VGRDITAQKAISDALSESESRFRTLTETTTAAIFILQGKPRRLLQSRRPKL